MNKTTEQLIAEFLQNGGRIKQCKPGETAIDPNSGLSHKRTRDREVYLREMGWQRQALEEEAA